MANSLKEPTRLEDLEIDEVSLVSKGANRRKFIILKAGDVPEGDSMEPQFAEILKTDLGTEDQIRDTIGKTAPELSTDATDAMVGIVKLATAYSEELPSTIFDTLAEAAGFEKAFPFEKPPVKPEVPVKETPEEKKKRLEEELAALKQTKKGSKKMEKSDESDPITKALEKITKEEDIDSLPEEIQGPVRYLYKSNVELSDKIEKMEDDRLTKEFIAKAAEYQHIPKTETFATLLKSMSQKLTPEEFTAVEGIFKATEEGFKESSIFKEVGSEAAITGTPEGQLASLAKQRVEKSEGSITFAQAMSDVTMEHPEIYEDMLKQRGTR